MIMCVLLCYPVSIRIYYQQGGRFLVWNVSVENLFLAEYYTILIDKEDRESID